MGGDCDTVGSIACQMAGALYGVDDGMLKLYSEMEDFKSERYEVFLKGYKLSTKQRLELIAKKWSQSIWLLNKLESWFKNKFKDFHFFHLCLPVFAFS